MFAALFQVMGTSCTALGATRRGECSSRPAPSTAADEEEEAAAAPRCCPVAGPDELLGLGAAACWLRSWFSAAGPEDTCTSLELPGVGAPALADPAGSGVLGCLGCGALVEAAAAAAAGAAADTGAASSFVPGPDGSSSTRGVVGTGGAVFSMVSWICIAHNRNDLKDEWLRTLLEVCRPSLDSSIMLC